MPEYIDRAVAVSQANFIHGRWDDVYVSATTLMAIPTADVAPVVHGRWLHETTEGGFHIWKCSRCGRGMNDNPGGVDLYCYHCGAKMDEGKKNDN